MKSEKIKLSDIAKIMGISTISVSRALSGQEGVSDELRDRVLRKANEMGYLRTKNLEQNKVLVLHQKPFIQDNSNFSHIMQGMEKALQAAGCEYDMEFADKNNQVKLSLPNKLQKGVHYDGIIFIGGFDNSYVDFITKKISNYVCYTGYSPSKDCDGIWYNFNNSGYQQCEYLIKKGHKRIGYLGNHNGYVSKEKILGIISAMEDHGLTAQNQFFVYSEDDYEERMIKLIKKTSGPTALICQWDYTAMKLIKSLHDHGIKVPEDISIIGHGNTEMSALCIPALTTMEIYIDYACESTVALLLKRLGRPDKPSENILIDSTLIERDSVKNLI
ncbi:MAG: LacI family DNA-binding transcriptional regulator [Anaerocolumna sp.]